MKAWARPLLAVLLAVAWLVALGAGANQPPAIAYAVLVLVLGTFWACHVRRDWPRGFHHQRLVAPARRWWLWALAMTLGLVAWRLLAAAELLRAGWISEASLASPVTLWTAVAAIAGAPLIEEFGFRLWLQSSLERLVPLALALLLTATVFAALHEPSLAPLHFVSALVYGTALRASGSIWLSVAMHALANGLLALLLLPGLASLWPAVRTLSPTVAMVSLLALAGALWLGARLALQGAHPLPGPDTQEQT